MLTHRTSAVPARMNVAGIRSAMMSVTGRPDWMP